MSVVFVQFTWNICVMYYMKSDMQTTILKSNNHQEHPRASWSERPKPKPRETKANQKPWAISQVKASEGKWSQVKPKPKAKSQKPKAKWARKWEILAPKCMQNTDFSSKMQQIARKAAPGWKAKKNFKKYPPNKSSRMMRSAAIRFSCW